MKLNAETVKKALECCASGNDCTLCPYIEENGCSPMLIENALSLINELTEHNAQILSFGEEYEALARKFEAENENLHASCTELTRKCANLTKENERLKKDNEYILMQHAFQRRPSGDCWNDVIEKAKADTVREMQERLKEHLQKPEFPWDSFTVAEEFIDQIAKEMLEGKTNDS